jgi:hypothetical protein
LAGSAQRLEIDASLIKLTLNSAIPVEEIAGLLKIKRTGDIFTFAKDYLYLFLFQCGQSELQQVLAHLFSLPMEDLFLGQEVFCNSDEIIHEIKNIPVLGNDYSLSQKKPMDLVNEAPPDNNKKPRRAAVPAPLKLKPS